MAHIQYFKYILILPIILLCYPSLASVIDRDLLDSLIAPNDKADILIDFAGGNSQAIKNIESKTFEDDDTQAEELISDLKALTNLMQEPVTKVLQNLGIQSTSFWSSNQMVIKSANLPILQILDLFPQISRIQKLPMIKLDPKPSSIAPTTDAPTQWNIEKIEAPKAWSITRGAGVVVCNIDTGVHWTHEILRDNFRPDHSWYDPYDKTSLPFDLNGHGTHTMGTICGKNGYGVAPDANWIACRGCDTDSCGGDALLACGQWCLRPTDPDGISNPDHKKRPHVISCSWGSLLGRQPWFNATVAAWTAAKISHAFAIGNSGPLCVSAGSPGDQEEVFSVGSTDKNDRLSWFSSKGPFLDILSGSTDGLTLLTYKKPDVKLFLLPEVTSHPPGTLQTVHTKPFPVAGTIALMCALHPKKRLTFKEMVAHITGSTNQHNLTLGLVNVGCDLLGSKKPGNVQFPNNEFGCGRLNAWKAVESVKNDKPDKSNCKENIKEIIIIRVCIASSFLGVPIKICLPFIPPLPEIPIV